MTSKELAHKPVLINEIIKLTRPKDNETYFDATFGNGGYSKEFLELTNCNIIAIDMDPFANQIDNEFKKKYGKRFDFFHSKFSKINEVMEKTEEKEIDGFVFDIGVSSMQLDFPERGFSFMKEGPLDMRMGQEGTTAYDVVNSKSHEELADIIYYYGDEKNSRRIAREIEIYRKSKKIETTLELAEVIKKCFSNKYYKKHPATKTFQALRIYINNELEELHSGLNHALKYLKKNGNLCVVTFHSLEDRLVKNFLRIASQNNKINKVLKPSKEEIEYNSRSRSAKLRFYEKNNLEFGYVPIEDLGFKQS